MYDHESGNFVSHNKYYGRQLNQETFSETIEDFFKYHDHSLLGDDEKINKYPLRTDIMSKVISTLDELISVLTKLETYRFYTASLLVTYDGQLPVNQPINYEVRLIDFAHSTHRSFRDEIVHEGPDLGFIQGLKSLVWILQQLIQKNNANKAL